MLSYYDNAVKRYILSCDLVKCVCFTIAKHREISMNRIWESGQQRGRE